MDPNRHIPLYKRLKADGFDFQASGHFRENELYYSIRGYNSGFLNGFKPKVFG